MSRSGAGDQEALAQSASDDAMQPWLARVLPGASTQRRALILLNTPLSESVVRTAWDCCSLRICSDGAANRLLAVLPDFTPDLVVGDMDSITPAARDHYSARGCSILDLHEDQDSTDLDKALATAAGRGCTHAAVIGNFCGGHGRLDHTFGIVQSLFLALAPAGRFEEIVVASDCAAMQLLLPGVHRVQAVPGCACGLVPVHGAAEAVTTSGLKWDLHDDRMAFGHLVSTSNHTQREEIDVTTSAPLLWTLTFPAPHAAVG